jgi:hypothetical protein
MGSVPNSATAVFAGVVVVIRPPLTLSPKVVTSQMDIPFTYLGFSCKVNTTMLSGESSQKTISSNLDECKNLFSFSSECLAVQLLDFRHDS